MAFDPQEWLGHDEDINNIDRLRQIREDLTKIRDSPGKKYLDKVLRTRYHGLMAGLAGSPLQSLDAALGQEYIKGQAFECLYQEQLCEHLVAYFDEAIQNHIENQEIEEEFNG